MTDQAKYMREYRSTPAGQRKVNEQNARTAARRRALVRLSELHPDDFRTLFQDELAKANIKRGLRD